MAKQDEQQDEHEQEQDGQQEWVRVVAERPVIEVAGAVGGWPYPWPNVAELASALPADRWTLIGGLMAQMHAINRGIDAVRPTNDVDIVLHIETERGTPRATVAALERIGYRMLTSIDPLNPTAHRFTRGTSHADVIAGDTTMEAKEDQIDVVVADHPAPSVEEMMRRMEMVKIEGGTQALKRTANYRLKITPGEPTTISVPQPFGALILKAAAYKTDSRDPGRHLNDAAVLLACIEDPFEERDGFAGSDRSRLLFLQSHLAHDQAAWRRMPREDARRAQQILRILCAD